MERYHVTAQANRWKVPGTYRIRQKTQSLPVTKVYGVTKFRQKCQAPEQLRYHYKYGRITIDTNKCFGKSCIRGLRMPVTSLLSYLASEMTVEEILEEWPELEREDIYQALGYA